MNLAKVFAVVNQLTEEGVIEKYALGGSIGVVSYTEPISTKDVDFFIVTHLLRTKKLVDLSNVYERLMEMGYDMSGQFFVIGDVPVDFIPATALSEEGIDKAVAKEVQGVRVRVFRPEYLVALALEAGRAHDYRKIEMLLSQAKVNKTVLRSILKRHNLHEKWKARFGQGQGR